MVHPLSGCNDLCERVGVEAVGVVGANPVGTNDRSKVVTRSSLLDELRMKLASAKKVAGTAVVSRQSGLPMYSLEG